MTARSAAGVREATCRLPVPQGYQGDAEKVGGNSRGDKPAHWAALHSSQTATATMTVIARAAITAPPLRCRSGRIRRWAGNYPSSAPVAQSFLKRYGGRG